MAYGDYTLVAAETAFGLRTSVAPLFPGVAAIDVPGWLRDQLARGRKYPLTSEKMRGELIVMPVLLAAVELAAGPVTVYSGVRMDADAALGLTGECDFVLARSLPLPELRAPLVTLVEAKKADVELGIGQCAAQMVGAKVFNEKAGRPVADIYGCVTTGEIWQFLRLRGSDLTLDFDKYFLDNLPLVLAVFATILTPPA